MKDTGDQSGAAMQPVSGTSYGTYLGLDTLLASQHPITDPVRHDEMLFIIQHQVAELWFKLMLHEIDAATALLRRDELKSSFKILARIKEIQMQLANQWTVLATLTPSDYLPIRGVFGSASGFQSVQYREVEFAFGNKDERFLELHANDADAVARLESRLSSPSLYDEFLRYLGRTGHAMPEAVTSRDWRRPYVPHPQVTRVFREIYLHTSANWDAYDMCEKLVDLEENFQLWRFRHMRTVARIIGFKPGTGGTSGVSFLKRVLEVELFPELIDVRTEIG